MKKSIKFSAILFVVGFFLISPTQVLAKKAGVTADNPFHFFDTLAEEINVLVSFSPESKAKKEAQIKEERKAEIEALNALHQKLRVEKQAEKEEAIAQKKSAQEQEQIDRELAHTEAQLLKQQAKTEERLKKAEEKLAEQLAKIEDKITKEEVLSDIKEIEEQGVEDRQEEAEIRAEEIEAEQIAEEPLAPEFIPEEVVQSEPEVAIEEGIVDEEVDEVAPETEEEITPEELEIPEEEVVVKTPRKDPFEDFPEATDVDPAVLAITYENFEFVQTDETDQAFRLGGIFVKGDKDLVVKFKYTAELPSLKTIGLALRYPDDANKVFSFLLKPKPENSYFIARTTALGEEGNYPVTIYLINHQNEIMKKISGELVVAGDISFRNVGSEMVAKVLESFSFTWKSFFEGI